ncbi:MAG: CpsD/CapB family tyrosine-protein kinase [Magnetococcales bacterium]|nr:CpsD/CapB family tyrosine-protein kinase [Magnetococcales bacterium]
MAPTSTSRGLLEEGTRTITERNHRELSTIEGNLITASGGKDVNTLLVTSCTPRDGKTTAAVGIAVTMAKMPHTRVLLLDGNLHNPRLHELFSLSREDGFSDYILSGGSMEGILSGGSMEGADVGGTIRETDYPNLFLMTAGRRVDNSLEVFRDPNFASRFQWLTGHFTHLVFDAPFYLGPSDASLVARLFDGILLVIACERTKRPVIQLVKERIAGAGGHLLGVILNRRQYYIPPWAYRFI